MVSKNNQMRVYYDELSLEDDMKYTYKGQAFTGIAFELSEGGALWIEDSMVEGRGQGFSREYFATGHLKSAENLDEDSLHGLCKYWYENGQLEAGRVYEHGILVQERTWDENGNI